MLHLFRPVKYRRHYEITLRIGFFQNDDNQLNIGDPIEDIMITEYQCTTPYIVHAYAENFAKTHVHDVLLEVIYARKWLRMQICPY